MSKLYLKALALLCPFIFSMAAFSQNVTTIDYQSWNPQRPPCNLFGTATSVPATVNNMNITIVHQSITGNPQYNSTDKAVTLSCKNEFDPNNNNVTATKGTEYSIAYQFKKGYSYKIEVVAACINGNTAYLRLEPNIGGNTTSNTCTGPSDIQPIYSGNLIQSKPMIGGATFTTYQFLYGTFTSPCLYLNVAAVPLNSFNRDINIRKIIITETLTQQFTVSPTSTNVSCGTSESKTFTVTPGDIEGVTSYEWNLGGTNTGWLYQGQPVLQPVISTPTNSLTLTTTCGTFPSPLSVTIKTGSTNYQTKNVSINVADPFLTIEGPSGFCTSGQYTINNLPCNATITGWTVTPSTAASVSGTNPVTVTKTGGGVFTLKATVTACGKSNDFTRSLTAGDQTVTVSATSWDCYAVQFNVLGTSATSFNWTAYGDLLLNGTSTTATTSVPTIDATGTGLVQVSTTKNCGAQVFASNNYQPYSRNIQLSGYSPLLPGDQLSVYIDPVPYANNYRWLVNGMTVAEGQYQTSYCTCYGGEDYRQCDYNTVSVEVDTDCGTFPVGSLEFEQMCNYYGVQSEITAYPNPATDQLTVQLKAINGKGKTKLKYIKELKVFDRFGQVKKVVNYGTGNASVRINISELPTGMYMLEASDGVNKVTIQVSKIK